MAHHGGRLPPDPAHPPTLVEQAYGVGSKAVTRNGYTYNLDPTRRTRVTFGELSSGRLASRSRANQSSAGGADRLHDDDGGHFIAARFNGPRDAYNHFAQNASFNRGAYRAMEDGWARVLKAGKHVSVNITALYVGASKRPTELVVQWDIDGRRNVHRFKNARGGR